MTSRSMPPTARRRVPPAPAHLEPQETKIWADLLASYRLDDAGSLLLLQTTLEAHQRARRCREHIDATGEAVRDRFGQLKPNPLLAAERDARAAFLAGMRILNLDVGESR